MAKGDVDSFLAASSKKGFTSRIIVSTAKDWGPTIEKQLDNLTVPVVRIGVSDLLESKVDWGNIDWTRPQQVLPTTGKKTALPHQREARTAVREGLTTNDRGQLIMACGTGKTFTSLKIAEELATGRKAEPTTVLFLVPRSSCSTSPCASGSRKARSPSARMPCAPTCRSARPTPQRTSRSTT